MGKLKYFLMIALAGAAMSPTVRAGVLATDGFETYNTGQLANVSGDAPSGGTGVWNGPWQVDATKLDWVNVVDRSMTYDNGSVHVNGGNHAVVLTPNIGGGVLPLSRQFDDQTGDSLYMSFLLQVPTFTDNEFLQFGFENQSPTPDNNIRISGGIEKEGSPKFFVREKTSSSSDKYGEALVRTATYFVVLKISKTASNFDQVQLFVNPDSGVEADQLSITSTTSGDVGWGNAKNWLFRTARADDAGEFFYVDQFTLGDTFASVVPVPEPTTGVLMLLGLGGLMMWPRRKNCA